MAPAAALHHARQYGGLRPDATLPEALAQQSADHLRGLLALLPRERPRPTRKAELVAALGCADAALAEQLATHARTAGPCRRTGERGLVVRTEAEDKFRRAIRELGYGMPRR